MTAADHRATDVRAVEETLIRRLAGWPVAASPDRAPHARRFPVACWCPEERCFRVWRAADAEPCRFSPTRSLRDCLEIRRCSSGENAFELRLARPVWEGNVRVVADFGGAEVVAEARSLPWTVSMALYRAATEGLL